MAAQARCVLDFAACAAAATVGWPSVALAIRSAPCSRTPVAVARSPDRHALRAYDTISAHNAEGSLFVPPLVGLAEVDAMRRHDMAADARARLDASRARTAPARRATARNIPRAVETDTRRSFDVSDEATRRRKPLFWFFFSGARANVRRAGKRTA